MTTATPTAEQRIEGLLAELVSCERKLTTIENDMNKALDAVKARADVAKAEPTARIKEIDAEIRSIAKLYRRELLPGKEKSREFAFGVIGYRKGSGKIKPKHRVKVDQVIQKLRDLGLTSGIKIKPSLDLAAMKTWTDERLDSVGLRRQTREQFFITTKTEKL